MLLRPNASLIAWTTRASVNLRVPSCSYAKKWKYRAPKQTKLPVELFSYEKPISGSAGYPEDKAEVHSRKFEFDVNSLTSRGFLRFQKSYTPPEDVVPRFFSLVKSLSQELSDLPDKDLVAFKLKDSRFKFDLLSRANEEFEHSVPNSLLYFMEHVGDVLQFYSTPIENITPFDKLVKMRDLPPNLYVQKNPLRFDPETDTAFGGISAFPKSSTIVTGLHAKKKYKSIHTRKSWV